MHVLIEIICAYLFNITLMMFTSYSGIIAYIGHRYDPFMDASFITLYILADSVIVFYIGEKVASSNNNKPLVFFVTVIGTLLFGMVGSFLTRSELFGFSYTLGFYSMLEAPLAATFFYNVCKLLINLRRKQPD
jgi:hypothetical protein